jgi:hypothetical protein
MLPTRPKFEAIGMTFGQRGLAHAKALVSKNRSTVRAPFGSAPSAIRSGHES